VLRINNEGIDENYYIIICRTIISVFPVKSFAQDLVNHQTVFLGGLPIEYGLGSYALSDEYISKEKYSEALPYFSVNWSRFHKKYGFRKKLEFRSSSEVKNYNISTDIVQFALHRDYHYPAGKFTILSKDVSSYLGSLTELFLFFIDIKYYHK